MSLKQPFSPDYQSGVTLAPNGAAVASAIGVGKQAVFTNLGNVTVYVRLTASDSAAVASAADCPVLPLTQISLSKGQDDTRVSVYAATLGSIHVIAGDGF